LALGFQLDELVRNGFLKEYLQEPQGARRQQPLQDASQHKKYARGVMTIEAQKSNQTPEPDLVFIKTDLQDVVPHDNDPVVILVVTMGRKV